MIEENFGARAARASIAHGPEIIAGRDTDDLVIGQARDLLPECGRVFILRIDRNQQLLCRKAIFLSDQIPCELDRLVFEIIAK